MNHEGEEEYAMLMRIIAPHDFAIAKRVVPKLEQNRGQRANPVTGSFSVHLVLNHMLLIYILVVSA